MSRRCNATHTRSGEGCRTRPPEAGRCPAAGSASGDALRHRKYRDLIRGHLSRLLDQLFADFTGLHFHVAWAPGPAQEWEEKRLPTACSVCCQLSGAPLHASCRVCGPRQLGHTLRTDGAGHAFTCPHGVRNHWFTLRIRDEVIGVAYLQALDRREIRSSATGTATHTKPGRTGRREFARAAKLLRFLIEHVQASSLADLRKAELTGAGHALIALEREQARLHEALQRHLPVAPQTPRRPGPESHPDQLVHRLLQCSEENYGKPITLRQCASQLGKNPAYLSDLFSRAVGVPFKTHLTQLRLTKARQLLDDPSRNISEVALAVGFASENRFRIAFKKATGLSPTVWRETMRSHAPPEAR
jgi:AraC-like DNA-binding protein